MPTKVKKLLDKGTNNPIVARTTVHISDLMSAYPLSDDERQSILSAFGSLMRRLLRMQELRDSLSKEYEKIRTQVREEGLTQLGEDAYEVPQIMGLDAQAEDFLQAAKLALIDCGSLFEPLYAQTFDHRIDLSIAWLEEELGVEHEFVKRLRKHHDVWIKELIDRRNALEHPRKRAKGKLHIENIDIDVAGAKLMGSDPSWHLTGDESSSIIEDTRILIENILRLAEEILVSSLGVRFPDTPVMAKEIPEHNRDVKAPVRFVLVPRGNILGA